jgi:2-oxoglutarate dehydrogenase E2 component (dihydrolipoamide succinyltransferase)
MPVEIKIPTIGESITEGTISRWLKNDGDYVRAGDPVLELETEKATTEVPAPSSGLLRVGVREAKTVSVGSVVGQIEEGAAPPNVEKSDTRKPTVVEAPLSRTPHEPPVQPTAPLKVTTSPLSPAARQVAADRGVDAAQVTGSGRGGLITKDDVLQFLERRQQQPVSAVAAPSPSGQAPEQRPTPRPNGRETRRRMSAIRQRIADRLIAAQQTAAILTTFNEADMSAVIALRTKYKDAFQKKHGVSLGFVSFFVKTVVEVLRAFPVVNAWIDGSEVVYHNYFDIGVAVSTEKGLMVPVIRDAANKSFADIENQLAELAQKAREGKIAVTDLQGGTFTITNGGVFGSLLSTPILNPPQSAILGMHAIQKRPVVVDDQIVIRPMMYLALSYDHRLIDGRDAVQFLVRVKECIESPERLMLEL